MSFERCMQPRGLHWEIPYSRRLRATLAGELCWPVASGDKASTAVRCQFFFRFLALFLGALHAILYEYAVESNEDRPMVWRTEYGRATVLVSHLPCVCDHWLGDLFAVRTPYSFR